MRIENLTETQREWIKEIQRGAQEVDSGRYNIL